MKAIIMAGGEGKRLRPITERIPKPLVEVGGIPIIEHIFKLLIKHNISEAWITTRYLGNLIEERFGDSYFWTVIIRQSCAYVIRLKTLRSERQGV